MNDDALLREARLTRGLLTALLMLQVQESDGAKKDAIRLLDLAGLQPKEIAELVDSTSNAVRVALVGIRSQRKKATQGTKT